MNVARLGLALVLAGAFVTPSFANWFDAFEYGANHKRSVGSTPSPTPDDLRAIGDSPYGKGKTYEFDPKSGHFHEVKDAVSKDSPLPSSPDTSGVDETTPTYPAPLPETP
jgi:hypothetical protein